MLRVAEDAPYGSDLRDPSTVKHENLVADFTNDAHLVSDEDDRDLESPVDVLEQTQNRKRRFRVESRRRLVAEQNIGAMNESTGDADALFLSA